MLDQVFIGKDYQNIKTGDIYVVTDLVRHSEDPSVILVIYSKRYWQNWARPLGLLRQFFRAIFSPLKRESWARPLELFKEKFREVNNDRS